MALTYRTVEGDMLDRICWKHYGRQSQAVEAVLEANPRLADHGEVLPGGLVITLPDLPAQRADSEEVNLWD